MDAPAAGGRTHVPKRHYGVTCGARGYVGAAAAAAGDSIDGFEGPGVGKGERGDVGGANVVDAHEAVEPARDDDLVRGTPRGRGRGGGDAVHGCGPLVVGVALRLGRAERRGGRRGDGGGRDGVDGERGVGRRAKGGEGRRGRGGEECRPGTGVQVYHVQKGGGRGGQVEKTGFAVGRYGQQDVAGDGEGFDQFAVVVGEGGAGRRGGVAVDGKVDLTGVTGRDPEALEFSVFETEKKCAVCATIRDASEAGDITTPGRVLPAELVGCLE